MIPRARRCLRAAALGLIRAGEPDKVARGQGLLRRVTEDERRALRRRASRLNRKGIANG